MEHLTAGQLAGYLDDRLESVRRQEVERHLDDCAECRGELAGLGRFLTGAKGKAGGWRTAGWRWGVPAVVAAAVGALALFPWTGGEAPGTPIERPGGAVEVVGAVTVVGPGDGAVVPRSGVRFTWRGQGADTYRLTLLTDTGELVWTVDTADTMAIPPRSLPLNPGAVYFWRVEAIADGIAAASGVRRFEIVP